MKLSSLLKQSLNSILHNKTRSLLTVLGIVIGVASVISLVALGNGLEESTLDRFSNLGAERITISSQDPSNAQDEEVNNDPRAILRAQFGGGGSIADPSLTPEDYEMILEFENIELASPQIVAQGLTVDGDNSSTNTNLTGVDANFLGMEEIELSSGVFISSEDVAEENKVIVISQSMEEELFETEALGKDVEIGEEEYSVVGVLLDEDQEASGFFGRGRFGANQAYIPYTVAMGLADADNISTVIADVIDEELAAQTAESLIEQLYISHNVDEDNSDVSITIAQDTIDAISSTQSSFTDTLTGIAAISLLVGGIGIMNIMLVTVTERTREIGLRRAVGAKRKHIVAQFLSEAVLLTFIGGLFGLLFGVTFGSRVGDIVTLGRGPSADQEVTAIVDGQTIVLALCISILVGVVFGLFPAIKAANKDPVEALRYE